MDALSVLRRFCETSRLHEVRVVRKSTSNYGNGSGDGVEKGSDGGDRSSSSIVIFGREYGFDARAPTALLERNRKNAVDLESVVVFAQYFLLKSVRERRGDDLTAEELRECEQRTAKDAKDALTSSWKDYLTKTTRTKLTRVNRLDVPSLIDYLCGTTTIDSYAAVHGGLISIEAPLSEPIGDLTSLLYRQHDKQTKQTQDERAVLGGDSLGKEDKAELLDANDDGTKRKAYFRDLEEEDAELRKRERASVGCERVLLCRKGKHLDKVLRIEQTFKERRSSVKGQKEVKQRHTGYSKEERSKQQQLQYDRTRKQKMVQGAGRNRFDDVDEKLYYKNAVGSSAADLRMGGFLKSEDHSERPAGAENAKSDVRNKESNGEKLPRTQSPKILQLSREQRARAPIILVPAGYKTILTKVNAKHFLEEGKYVPSEECLAGGQSKRELWIQRTYGRKVPVLYEVRDRAPEKLKDQKNPEWKRVIAVFVLGAKWQFKDWPFKGCEHGDMVEAFSRIRAFHLRFNNESVKQEIRNWNVKMLDLDRNSRYKDFGKVQEFWDELDVFMGHRNKYNLKY